MVRIVEFNAMTLWAVALGEAFRTADDACNALLNSGFQLAQDIPEEEFKRVFNARRETFYLERWWCMVMFNTYSATAVCVVPCVDGD